MAKHRGKLSDRRSRHDRFHRQAKAKGLAARSVFKLEELDQKTQLIPRSARILDLGCAPGSWLQYASIQSGPGAILVGVDRRPIDISLANFRMVVGDVMTLGPDELLGELEAFDVVLSDMAPDTTGVRRLDQDRSEALFERALEIAETTLGRGGNFAGKLFQGPEFAALVRRCRERFERVKIVKPASSRTQSIEQYVVALGYRS